MFAALSRVATRSRIAGLMVLVGAGALLWHVLACVESPMAFSPDGKNLAFVTMEPFELKGTHLAGPHCFRLFVASGGKDLREIEQSTDAMLTAPAYSPDGKQICYLRIPLLTEEQARLRAQEEQARRAAWNAANLPTSRPGADNDQWRETKKLPAVPDVGRTAEALRSLAITGQTPAELVLRNAADYSLVKAVRIDLPAPNVPGRKNEDGGWLDPYVHIRPVYSADGQWIYLCVGKVLLALNPETMVRQVLAAPADQPALTPDRRRLAYVDGQDGSLVALVQTDGTKATYVRWPGRGVVQPVAWCDNETLALAGQTPEPPSVQTRASAHEKRLESISIFFMRSDGTLLSDRRIDLPPAKEAPKDMTISPDGRHAAACFPERLVFLDSGGKLLGEAHVPPGEPRKDELPNAFAQPTFAPDGKSLAVKLMTNDGAYRTTAVVFFSPEGKELSRVAIPRIAAGTTRPASASASAPAPAQP
ncbi:MAG: hypothetical protein NTV86_17655 [Planctomycetota bacterium]|nr:hypothetical protein [Planctomycetota bacterium]